MHSLYLFSFQLLSKVLFLVSSWTFFKVLLLNLKVLVGLVPLSLGLVLSLGPLNLDYSTAYKL